VASPREKDRARGAAAAKKPAAGARPALAHAKLNDSARPDVRTAGGKALETSAARHRATRSGHA